MLRTFNSFAMVTLVALCTATASVEAQFGGGPIIVGPPLPAPVILPSVDGWQLMRIADLDLASGNAIAPHFGADGEIFVGVHGAERGLYRVAPGATSADLLVTTDDSVSAVDVDHETGNVFYAAEHLYRRSASGADQLWVGLYDLAEGGTLGTVHGIAIAPDGYFDPMAGSSTRGFFPIDSISSDDGVMRSFSTLQSDVSSWFGTYPFQNPTDACYGPGVTPFASHTLYVSDHGYGATGMIWRMAINSPVGGTAPTSSVVATTEALEPDAIVYDAQIGKLLVLDRFDFGHRIVRVDLDTGEVESVGSVIHGLTALPGSLDISPDGLHLVVTDGDKVYVFDRETDNFIRGDSNADGSVDIADAIAALQQMIGESPMLCLEAMDVNDDDTVNIADVIHTLMYVTMGADIAAPFPNCGNVSGESLGCNVGGC